MFPRWFTALLLLLSARGGWAEPAPVSMPAKADALVLAVQGDIATGLSPETTPALTFLSPLRVGEALFVAPGAELTLLCADGTCRRQATSFVVGPELCSAGEAIPCRLPEVARRELLPSHRGHPAPRVIGRDFRGPEQATPGSSPADAAGRRILGRWLTAQGDWHLVGHARGAEERWGLDPVLVSPRCPEGRERGCEVWNDEPRELLFMGVAQASRYRFVLTGPGRWEPLTLRPDELHDCRPRPAFKGATVCRHPWPATWRLPDSGRMVRLKHEVEVGHRRSSTRAQRLGLAAPGIRTGAEERPTDGDRDLRWLLEALVFSRHSAEASLFASWFQADRLLPALELKLAVLYLERDLPRPAAHHFSRLAASPTLDPRLRAEAELGLATTHRQLGRPTEALQALERTEALFAQLDEYPRRKVIEDLKRRIESRLRRD